MTTTIESSCSYHRLLDRPDDPKCVEPATHYVCLTIPAVGTTLGGERYVNLCADHEAQVRTEFRETFRWSRPKRVTR